MTLSERVDELMSSGNYRQAGEFLERELERARETNNTADELCVLNEQLGYYRCTGQHEKAMEACDRVLVCLEYYQGHGDEDCATTLLNAATACRAAGQPEKALELYVMAGQIYGEVLEPGDTRYAALYNNAALACRETGAPDRAKVYLASAVNILEGAGEEYTGELATALANLGLMLMGAGEYDTAEEQLDRALALFDRLGNDPHRAAALAGAANLRALRGEYRAAIPLYRAALEQIEFYFGRTGDYAVTCRNCAAAAAAAGDDELAREMRALGEGR